MNGGAHGPDAEAVDEPIRFSPSTYSRRSCEICGQSIRMDDVIVLLDTGAHEGPAHVACTKDGVERWLREGAPRDHPLTWDRAERPRWDADARRTYVHVGGGLLADNRLADG